ncbi:MAG: glycosyltransferase family 2 protein [Polyangiaceae bacterium]
MTPDVSFVIPVYNEEPILHAAIVDLREQLVGAPFSYEIVLAENGSKDGTVRVAERLESKLPNVSHFSIGAPNYGAALRGGIERARGKYVVCEEIDLCDVDFHSRAVELLERGAADLVIGSKLLAASHDDRPLTRHAASLLYNRMLRVTLGFRGTDTHGLKAFDREVLLPIVRKCVVDRDVFASELVIRADREGVRVTEIPVRVLEKRTPSINLVSRVPNVIKNLAKLTYAIRFR